MGFLDPAKILVVLVLALIVLGPDRLPRAARQLGAAWREFTRMRDQVTDEIRSAIPDLDLPNIPRMPKNVVSGFISDLTRPSTTAGGAEEGALGEAGDEHGATEASSASAGSARDAAADADEGGSLWPAPAGETPVASPAATRPVRAGTTGFAVPLDDDPSMN
ncbi:MAG: twin-arginine translocase TatA/TatE family subunit [Actinomycetota bacterium]|nr:twin-arginine translocase TatA/TatE family subunit [Actinomycetota bacterium]